MNPLKSAHVISFNEVTAKNITVLSSAFLKKVSDASYIALDLEFTGLSESHPKDMNHRYIAYKKTVEAHAMVSMGISVVKQTSDHVYECDNFHFLTLKQGNLTIDTSTGQFLLQHQFSFDQLFREGAAFWPPWHGPQYSAPLNELFKGLMKLMARRSIPLVTHNGLYDLLYIYHSFIGELPKTLGGFLKDFSNRFPAGVYDTKFIIQEDRDCEASFLSYVFGRYDRLRQRRFENSTDEKPYFEVNVCDPIVVESQKREAEVSENLSNKKQKGLDKKGVFCKQFAERGYCEFGHEAKSKYHDIETILDHQLGPSRCPVNVAEIPIKEKEASSGGAHSSHFDAYMTAFVYCYLRQTMGKEVEKNKNKLNIGCMDIPLTFPDPSTGRPKDPVEKQEKKE